MSGLGGAGEPVSLAEVADQVAKLEQRLEDAGYFGDAAHRAGESHPLSARMDDLESRLSLDVVTNAVSRRVRRGIIPASAILCALVALGTINTAMAYTQDRGIDNKVTIIAHESPEATITVTQKPLRGSLRGFATPTPTALGDADRSTKRESRKTHADRLRSEDKPVSKDSRGPLVSRGRGAGQPLYTAGKSSELRNVACADENGLGGVAPVARKLNLDTKLIEGFGLVGARLGIPSPTLVGLDLSHDSDAQCE